MIYHKRKQTTLPIVQPMLKLAELHRIRHLVSGFITLLACCVFFNAYSAEQGDSHVRYGYEIVNQYPHDPTAFTQGLVYSDGKLFESTGLWGKSRLREVTLETGKAAKEIKLDKQYFGEGLELYDNKLYQLTWKTGLLFVYDCETFERLATHKLTGHGWGLTETDGKLVKSDGTSRLTFLDPASMKPLRIIDVTREGKPVWHLNELEMVNGLVYANIYQTDEIVMISPNTGVVVGTLDLGGLLKAAGYHGKAGVLNGIAYDEKHDRLFITGKLWPYLFEIKIKPIG